MRRYRPNLSASERAHTEMITSLRVPQKTKNISSEFFLWPTDSRPVRLGIGPPFGANDQIYISLLFWTDNYFYYFSFASSLTRKWVCSLECLHSLVRSFTTSNHTLRLIRDCVPFLSPLTTRRDYGGGILTRLHTGNQEYHDHLSDYQLLQKGTLAGIS
jgi:hypothetical protein